MFAGFLSARFLATGSVLDIGTLFYGVTKFMAIATLCLGEFRAVAGDVTIEGKVQIAAESTRHFLGY